MAGATDQRSGAPPAKALVKRELGRGEKVLPGVFRLRLPLPWPGVPHCNAWAVAAGDGVVSVTFSADGNTAAGSAEDGSGCSTPGM